MLLHTTLTQMVELAGRLRTIKVNKIFELNYIKSKNRGIIFLIRCMEVNEAMSVYQDRVFNIFSSFGLHLVLCFVSARERNHTFRVVKDYSLKGKGYPDDNISPVRKYIITKRRRSSDVLFLTITNKHSTFSAKTQP